VLFLDLDRFKVVNDSLGHPAGDQLLQAVALRLDAALRPGDTVARIGGDEFTVLLEDVTDAREAAVVAERVLATLKDPLQIAGRNLHVSGSIGIALGGPEVDPHELIRDADVAMYRSKAQGTARHSVFDVQMHRHVLARLDLETTSDGRSRTRRCRSSSSRSCAPSARTSPPSRRCAAGRSPRASS
jgi:diguanylate cyclase (GGDEF)-like protein